MSSSLATFAGEYPGSLTGYVRNHGRGFGLATFCDLTITGSVGSIRISSFGSGSWARWPCLAVITLVPGTPTQLAFSGQPSDALTGLSIAPPVQVTIKKDVSGTVPLSSSPITLSLTPGTGNEGGTLGGTNPKGTGEWRGNVSDLTVSVRLPAARSLTAASGVAGVSPPISSAFNVASPGPSGIETVAGAQTAVLPRTTIPAGRSCSALRDLANNPVPNVDVTLSGIEEDLW